MQMYVLLETSAARGVTVPAEPSCCMHPLSRLMRHRALGPVRRSEYGQKTFVAPANNLPVRSRLERLPVALSVCFTRRIASTSECAHQHGRNRRQSSYTRILCTLTMRQGTKTIAKHEVYDPHLANDVRSSG